MPLVSFATLDDDPRLQDLLDFAALHGRPRATSAGDYRALVRNEAAAARSFLEQDDEGRSHAAALATISPAIGRDQVQLNVFVAPEVASVAEVLAAVDAWAAERQAVALTVHASDPTPHDLDVLGRDGFEQVGERTRMVRQLVPSDAELPTPSTADVELHSLRERPDLAEAAERLWRQGHEDVPSALRFDSADLEPMRVEAGLADGDPWPDTVIVAVADGEVVGLAVGLERPGADRALGHRMTATERSWRGRGIARALKSDLLRRAARAGYAQLQTSNDEGNHAMRHINDELGYEPDSRILVLRRPVR